MALTYRYFNLVVLDQHHINDHGLAKLANRLGASKQVVINRRSQKEFYIKWFIDGCVWAEYLELSCSSLAASIVRHV